MAIVFPLLTKADTLCQIIVWVSPGTTNCLMKSYQMDWFPSRPLQTIVRSCDQQCSRGSGWLGVQLFVSGFTYWSLICCDSLACKPVVTCRPPASSVHLLAGVCPGCFLSTGDNSPSISLCAEKRRRLLPRAKPESNTFIGFYYMWQSQELTHCALGAKGDVVMLSVCWYQEPFQLGWQWHSVFTRIWLLTDSQL